MRVAMPSIEQVRQLPAQVTRVVPREWQDYNGHVNVQHYLGIYHETTWPLFESFGVDEARLTREGVSFFDLEHHHWFLAELHVGDTVSAHTRLLQRSAKRVHGVLFIVNDTLSQLASALEFISIGADLRTRRTREFPPDVAAGLQAIIERHASLDWNAPRCGSISA